MALPKLSAPYYKTTIPSTGKEIKFRPFLVREEKILMLALESNNESEIFSALNQIIDNCTDGVVDASVLPTFDIEYLFLQLRIKSIDSYSEINVRCPNAKCKKNTKTKIDLTNIEVKNLNNKKDFNIQLTDDIGVRLSYPTLDTTKSINTKGENTEFLFDFIIGCIENIYDSDQVYKKSDQTKEDMMDFLESLSATQFQKITDFFDDTPTLEYKEKLVCSHCNKPHTLKMSGLDDFFSYASLTTL
ncbi:TPA: baseplate protein [Candidatus Woesearchaeota archaeon]|nr:baseplate protein [Candidatus Woesearchaeota archaeon]